MPGDGTGRDGRRPGSAGLGRRGRLEEPRERRPPPPVGQARPAYSESEGGWLANPLGAPPSPPTTQRCLLRRPQWETRRPVPRRRAVRNGALHMLSRTHHRVGLGGRAGRRMQLGLPAPARPEGSQACQVPGRAAASGSPRMAGATEWSLREGAGTKKGPHPTPCAGRRRRLCSSPYYYHRHHSDRCHVTLWAG